MLNTKDFKLSKCKLDLTIEKMMQKIVDELQQKPENEFKAVFVWKLFNFTIGRTSELSRLLVC